ncbi:MAG: DNA polymerase III subunit psi [Legionellales bacterium]|jgi:DNA polymerase III psi subunit
MLTKTNYLDLMGITQWHLRTAPAVLIPQALPIDAQWLFILEKQELTQEATLLEAIFTAIKQTPKTVAIAYYDAATTQVALDLPQLQYIVLMGEEPLQQFQAQRLFAPDISVITSANLSTLAQDINAKRELWQQLKRHQI